MNAADLLRGMGHVDEALVRQGESGSLKKPILRFALPVAACLALVLGGISLYAARPPVPPPPLPTAPPEETQIASSPYSLHFNRADSQLASSLMIRGHFWADVTPEQWEALFPLLAPKYEADSVVNYSYWEDTLSIFNVESRFELQGRTAKVTIAPDRVLKCYQIVGEPILSQIEGVPIEAGLFVTDPNSLGEQTYIYYADFQLEDVAYYVEYDGTAEDEERFTLLVADILLGGKADWGPLENPAIPELREERLTQSQAYAETDFGAYLPRVPQDYTFESGLRFVNQSSDYLHAFWYKGYEDISIQISTLTQEDEGRLVAPEDTRLYDMSLYPIPWGESMPPDQSHIIENPIFRAEELSVRMLELREYVRHESSDPSGESVNLRFCVLYGDTLVSVSSEGVRAQTMFEALSLLPRS